MQRILRLIDNRNPGKRRGKWPVALDDRVIISVLKAAILWKENAVASLWYETKKTDRRTGT